MRFSWLWFYDSQYCNGWLPAFCKMFILACSEIWMRISPADSFLELVRNLVAHGDAREGKWKGNWRMECVAITLTPPPNMVYPTLLKLMRTPRLPAVDWTDAPTDLNGLVRFGERWNLVSACVPSRSARAIPWIWVMFKEVRKCANAFCLEV